MVIASAARLITESADEEQRKGQVAPFWLPHLRKTQKLSTSLVITIQTFLYSQSDGINIGRAMPTDPHQKHGLRLSDSAGLKRNENFLSKQSSRILRDLTAEEGFGNSPSQI